MTNQPEIPGRKTVDRIGQIAEQLNEVVEGLQEVTGYGKRTRRLTWIAIGTFTFDILLTVLLALSFSISQANTCHSANAARAGQVVIWHTIVNQFSAPPRTQQQRDREKRFLAFVDTNFHPLNCRTFYFPWNR